MFVFVNIGVMLGVGDSNPVVGVNVGINVDVAVSGTGDGSRLVVAVGAACGENSTRDMDNAPIVNPIEIKATASAFVKPRKSRIIYFL
jgi:hypothetical protein